MSTSTLIRCTGCAFEQNQTEETCLRCGLIFARVHAPASAPEFVDTPQLREILEPPPAAPAPAEWTAFTWKLLLGGIGSALLAHAIPFVAFVLSPLVTLLHEFGHAAFAWLLGCPAIPAFDFVYGGGVTHHKNFQLPLGLLIGAGWLWLGYTFRRNPRSLTLIVATAALWLLAISADWRREVVIAAMGHGGELILSGILLYMALTGVGWRMPEVERPLGAFAAFFVWFQTVGFAWGLRTDADYLAWYMGGKGGAMMNDLEVVALDIKIWTGAELDVPAMAGWLLAVSWVPIAAAILLTVYRSRWAEFSRSLRLLDPD